VPWPDRREVAVIEGGDRVGLESLRERDDRRIDDPEREILVLLRQLGDAGPVGVEDGFAEQLGGGERARERDLGVWSDAVGEQVGDLGDAGSSRPRRTRPQRRRDLPQAQPAAGPKRRAPDFTRVS
jgi:hypothetical protein